MVRQPVDASCPTGWAAPTAAWSSFYILLNMHGVRLSGRSVTEGILDEPGLRAIGRFSTGSSSGGARRAVQVGADRVAADHAARRTWWPRTKVSVTRAVSSKPSNGVYSWVDRESSARTVQSARCRPGEVGVVADRDGALGGQAVAVGGVAQASSAIRL